MAVTNYFVRSTGGSDSNGGLSHADAFATIQHAIDQTRGTDGTFIHCNGTFTLSTTLSLGATTASAAASVWLQGYGSTARDGIKATINGGSVGVWVDGGDDYIRFVDMEMYSDGTTSVVVGDFDVGFVNCEVYHNGSSTQALCAGDEFMWGVNSYFHDMGGAGLSGRDGRFINCAFVDRVGQTNSPNSLISTTQAGPTFIDRCIFKLEEPASDANALIVHTRNVVQNCSIWCNAGSGAGIKENSSSTFGGIFLNNLIQGFSATGGKGIWKNGDSGYLIAGNVVRDCATAYVTAGAGWGVDLDNETQASGNLFTDVSTSTDDWEPDDAVTASIKEGAYPGEFGGY